MKNFAFLSILLVNLIQLAYPLEIHDETNDTEAGSRFAWDLYKSISEENKDKNIVISPLSIRTCLALIHAGADGQTANELIKGLHLSNDPTTVHNYFNAIMKEITSSPLVELANKVYIKTGYTLKSDYKKIIQDIYQSDIESIEFEDSQNAVININNWANEKTKGKIKEIVSSDTFNELTRAILLNAIYFKGNWLNQFYEQKTDKQDFWITSTKSVQVDMMYNRNDYKYGESHELDATAIELPYANSDMALMIILPNQRDGLENLEKKLDNVNLFDISKRLRTREVIVKLPKFKIEFAQELKNTLKKMGIQRMFSNDAELMKIIEQPEPLYVSKVLHKAFIEVNEEGTEAAAITGITIDTRCDCGDFNKCELNADHSFIYVLKSKKQILFIGRLINPQ